MRFYVATKFENYAQAREVGERLKKLGHTPTCEWYSNHHEFDGSGTLRGKLTDLHPAVQLQCALDDFDGARNADFLVLLDYPNMVGAYVEVGIALANYRIVHVVGAVRDTVFWRLDNVVRHNTVDDFLAHFG